NHASAAVIPGERRKVAVLSFRINGLDDHAVNIMEDSRSRIMALAMDELSSSIKAFGGKQIRNGQDIIIGAFGTVHTTEHLCQRAIDCCFKMMRSLSLIENSIDIKNRHLHLSGSAGVAMGSVTFTPGTNGDFRINGDSIDLSFSLLNHAPPDSILVSQNTMESCGDWFSWELSPALKNSWIPKKKSDSHLILPRFSKVPFLDRDKELSRIRAAFNSYLKWFNHPAVLISGKPGSGKSRLVEHFLSGISSDDANIVHLHNRLWDQPPLGTWLPLMKKGTFDPYGTVMAEVRRLRSSGNLILVVEDIHWADKASVKLLDQLSQAFIDAGVFLIVTSRYDVYGFLQGSAEKILLKNFTRQTVISLLKSILGTAEKAEDKRFADFLMTSTSGNPLLLIEAIFHASETDVIGRNLNNSWFIDKKLQGVLSEASESSLHARMSILRPPEKFALQVASVLGNGFNGDLFSKLFTSLGRKSAGQLLSQLLNTGFLTTDDKGSYQFLNSFMAETVYDTILPENKVVIHRKAAELISEGISPDQNSAISISISRHFIESGYGEESLPWLLSAMEQYLDVTDLNKAESLSCEIQKRVLKDSTHSYSSGYLDMRLYILMGKFQLALNTAERIIPFFEGQKLGMIYHVIAQSKENLGVPLKEVIQDYTVAAETAEAAGDMNTAASSLGAAGAVLVSLGKKDEALSALNRALKHESSLDTKSLAKLHGNMGILMQRTGSLADALLHYRKTYEMGRKCGDSGIEANALAYMGHIEISMGEKEKGISKFREALAIHRNTGNKRGECITLGNMGGSLARFGEAKNAVVALQKAVMLAEEIGHTRGIMTFHANLGLAFKLEGQYSKAEKHIRESMVMIKKTGDNRALAVCHLNLSGVLSCSMKIREAIDEARRAFRFACAVNALTTQARALGNLGSLMRKTDRPRMGLNFYREAYKRSSLAEDHSTLAGHVIGESNCLLDLGMKEESLAKYNDVLKLKEKYGMDVEEENDLIELEKTLGITNE
ncbi:MAG: hypothetical protein U9P42_10630, partial [Candidatus Fermentibacteria bacterium]|nr:hypothetical protein [Candidatus Fermentibacteria bacterium]